MSIEIMSVNQCRTLLGNASAGMGEEELLLLAKGMETLGTIIYDSYSELREASSYLGALDAFGLLQFVLPLPQPDPKLELNAAECRALWGTFADHLSDDEVYSVRDQLYASDQPTYAVEPLVDHDYSQFFSEDAEPI